MKLSTQILLGFSIVILLSIIDSYANYTLSQKVKRNSDFLAKSEAIIRNSGLLHKTIIATQSAFRGYLLTDDEAFLEPFYAGEQTIPALFKEEALITNSKSQSLKLTKISALHKQWMDYANTLIEAKRNAIRSKASEEDYKALFDARFRKQFGQKLNNDIAMIFKDFDRYEYKVRQNRRELLRTSIEHTNTYSLIFIVFTIAIGVISATYIVLLISKRIAAMVNLAQNISNGNFVKIEDRRNDELTGLSVSLNSMSATLSKNIKDLETRNNELNQFAYVVSHDLKAPIRGIYNVVQWIREDMGNDLNVELKKYLNIIPERIARMEGLIDGLLDYARISRETPLKEPVDVNTLVQKVVEDIVPQDFEVTITPMPQLETERLRLEQVFSNLISNAVKYASQEQPKKIHIDWKDAGPCYEFTVKDNGIGIDPEYHKKIFVIFQTLREKHAKESTGIGLAIVKKILDDRHCSIQVVSERDKGSEFVFTWPKK